MPTYTYRCIDCGEKFTKIVPIAERDNQGCDLCGTSDCTLGVKRLIDKPGSVWAPTSTGGGHK